MIAKLCVLLGLHKYIVYYDAQEDCHTHSDVADYL
jgi:dsRNA-specific ribonuclease